jgi:carbon storage regulator CsrA
MLVLSRKTHESIQIGAEIQIRVLSVTGNRVKLGFEAPSEMRIVRTELLPFAPSEPISHSRVITAPAVCREDSSGAPYHK